MIGAIFPFLVGLEEKRYKQYVRVFLRQYQLARTCPACQGSRLNAQALAVRIGGQTIADPKQDCAALAAGLYRKSLVLGAFEGDVLLAVAAFGKSPQEAGEWKASLPQNRTDLWNAIKTPAEREQLVRFLAAGIVAENPQRFGLEKERPLSELYRIAM